MASDNETLHHPELTHLVLASFQQACSEDRLDVAEHLLVALEELADDRFENSSSESDALAYAYRLVAERAKLSPTRSGCDATAATR